MSFERAQKVADAVLLEGYVLYPYRASAPKNQFRWTFGVLAPRSWSEAGGSEPWWMEAQCLVAPDARPTIRGRFRFFRARRRRIEKWVGEAFRETESMEAGGRLLVPWDEGEVREIDFERDLGRLAADTEQVIPVDVPAAREVETVTDAGGSTVGRVVRESSAVSGRVLVSAERAGADHPLLRVCARAENLTPWDAPHAMPIAVPIIMTYSMTAKSTPARWLAFHARRKRGPAATSQKIQGAGDMRPASAMVRKVPFGDSPGVSMSLPWRR